MDDYKVLQVAKGATINECVKCGALVAHRMIHDAWHQYLSVMLAQVPAPTP